MRRLNRIDEARDLVKSAADLADVVTEYGIELQSAGKDALKALCPFHEETVPSFGISTDKQLFFCHGCKEGGDVFSFVQKMENITHIQAIEQIANMCGVDLGPYKEEETEEQKRERRLFAVNAKIQEWVEEHRDDEKFQKWIKDRVLDRGVLGEYGIGYAPSVPDVDAPPADLSSLDADWEGRWKGRVSIPLREEYGRVAGFRLKSIDGSKPSMRGPKSNHPLRVPPIYGLKEARKAIREKDHVILVEGEVDVWQMVSFGYRNTASTMGSRLNKEQVEYLLDREIRNVVLVPDADDAGRHWAKTVAREIWPDLNIKIASLDHGDPDELLLEDPAYVQEALDNAVHSIEYLVNDVIGGRKFDTITQKMDAVTDLRDVLKDVTGVQLAVAIEHIADRVGIDEEFLQDYFREHTSQSSKLHNVMGERIVLAKMLAEEEFVGDAILMLDRDDFYLARHQSLFSIIFDLFSARKSVSYETVRTELENRGSNLTSYLDTVADTEYDSAEYLLDDIRDKALRRKIRDRSQIVAQRLEDTSLDAQHIIQEFSSDVASAVVGGGDALRDIRSTTDARIRHMHRMAQDPNTIIGLDMGQEWQTLNHTIHGMQRKRYVILAAPSGVGKTAIGGAWMKRFAVDLGHPCLYLTFETGEETLTNRLLANISGVEQEKIITGHVTGDDVDLVQQAGEKLAAAPIVITERGRVSEEAASIIRHDVLKRQTRVVFVDYIQLMTLSNNRGIGRYNELGEISRTLFELTRELNISLIAMAQINRDGSKKGFQTKEDIGESYKIPQDSDIFYIVRNKTKEELRSDGPEMGDRYAIVDKHRHGREKVGSSIIADMATMRIKEAHKALQ